MARCLHLRVTEQRHEWSSSGPIREFESTEVECQAASQIPVSVYGEEQRGRYDSWSLASGKEKKTWSQWRRVSFSPSPLCYCSPTSSVGRRTGITHPFSQQNKGFSLSRGINRISKITTRRVEMVAFPGFLSSRQRMTLK